MSLIQGVQVAALTPRRKEEAAIDLAAALELVDFLGRSGLDGIALMGSTGEFPHFNVEGRRHLIRFAVKRSRVPVTVNVSHSCLDGAIELARAAVSEGAAALLLMPPYFFRYEPEQVKAFYLQFAREMENAAPILLYNIPDFTSAIPVETAVELLETGLFAGIKDSSGCIDSFRRLRELRQQVEFSLLVGNDRILAETRAAGADGAVSGVASAIPELILALDRAARGGENEPRERLDRRLREFLAWVDRFPAPVAIKEAAAARGLKTGPHAVPLGESGERLAGEFREWFPGWWKTVEKETKSA